MSELNWRTLTQQASSYTTPGLVKFFVLFMKNLLKSCTPRVGLGEHQGLVVDEVGLVLQLQQ